MKTRIAEGRRIVQSYTGWAAGSGLIPLPLADIAGLMATQVAMIRSLARLYAVPFERDRARAVAMGALGGLLPQGVAVAGVPSMLKFVPVFGTLLGVAVMPAAAVAVTVGLGEAFIRHFENGGVLRDADPRKIIDAGKAGDHAAVAAPVAQAADSTVPVSRKQEPMDEPTYVVAAAAPADIPATAIPEVDALAADALAAEAAPPPDPVAPPSSDTAKPAAVARRGGRIKRRPRRTGA